MHKPDNWLKAALGAVIACGLALIAVPLLYVATHRNERVRLENGRER